MLDRYASEFFFLGAELQGAERMLWYETTPPKTPLPLPIFVATFLDKTVKILAERCIALNLRTTLGMINTFEATLRLRNVTQENVHEELRIILRVAKEELKNVNFFFVKDAQLFEQPLSGWEATQNRFPETVPDIEEASRCLAFERGTAVVVHLMRVLEVGLKELAKDAKVPHVAANWNQVIEELEKHIKNARSPQGSFPKDKLEKVPVYSRAAIQFRFFKDAWRNYVTHEPVIYNVDQARGILISVRDFMNDLGANI